VVTSLAGVTREPAQQKGKVRRGGFGGVAGLADYLSSEGISLLIDATHPFAAQISAHAHAAAMQRAVPLVRLERPPWESPRDGQWQSVASLEDALAQVVPGGRILVTTGRKNLHLLGLHPTFSGVVRCIEAPDAPLPPGWGLVLERPPFSLKAEEELMQRHKFTHLICKNAGGQQMLTKVTTANRLRATVLMIERPSKPPCRRFATVEALLETVGSLT
jgi:precorrin-6A/cobalt-precorrin-6A reductase